MSVLPPNQSQSSQPSDNDDGPNESNRNSRKEFKLPKGSKDLTKKKGLNEGVEEPGVQEMKQNIQQQKMAEAQTAGQVKATQAKATVTAIGQLITRLVTDLKIGQMDGKNFANMNLTGTDVPESFAGSNLTLSYTSNALSIHFDNFMTPQDQNTAVNLVEKNKEQLVDMIESLRSKGITVEEMSIGNHSVALPHVEKLPPPFQTIESSSAETQQQLEREEAEEGEEGASPE